MRIHPLHPFAFLLLIPLVSTPALAQTPEADVQRVIDSLFDGMRAGDSTQVRSAFYPGALLGRATDQGLRTGPIDGFVNAVGSPHDQVWDERIWDVTIQVDQRLATAWMEYAFYLGDTLHHCGVNSMHFYRTDDGWKIAYLVDTDRGLTCDIPDDVKK